MTSVDVFGRTSKKSESNVKCLSNGGLNLTNDSLQIKLDPNASNVLSLSANGLMGYGLRYPLTFDFNVSNKRIYFVGDPINPQDAVNKRYVDNLIKNTLTYPLTHDFNANAFSVTNLATGQPLNGSNSLTYDDASNVFLKQIGTNVNLDMNGKKITGLDQSYPVSDNSQAVSWYQVLNFVNGKRVKNNVGFIPDLYGRANKKGFIVTTSSQLNSNSSPKSIFNDSSNEWSSSGMQENVWVQIQLPTPVCIWKFTIA